MASSAAAARRLLLLRHRHDHLLPKCHFSSSSAADGLDDSGGGGRVKIFDRDLKRRHRDRAAWAMRGIERLIMMDMSADMVKKWRESENATGDEPETHFVVGDEEFLPIKESSQDLIISCLGLHWTNDLPGAMIQVRDAGNLLTRAGFTLPGVDVDQYTVEYNNGVEKGYSLGNGSNLPVNVWVIYMTGWREHPSQQKTKRRGSATISFSDIQKQFGPSEN
ncbi:unnamed protein product [Miscanthus lutarioriparius]|uniref:Methyltransferase type 11 domain-containing protein n=1 Tax=Miscanthus lutarioriparius TaxID=422564 RepID=A0A811RDV9_9POAL|nr:unnamed protein product [Miscanthus lutarioriparius]